MFRRKRPPVPNDNNTQPDRPVPQGPDATHFVNGRQILGPFPDNLEVIYVGMGCFWGAERIFWDLPGVHVTAVGYMGGTTENPSYQDVCTGRTGHAEVAMVVYDPEVIPLEKVLKGFWEEHDPTQRDRQGNDVGSQYRSAIYWRTENQRDEALRSLSTYAHALRDGGFGEITTEVAPATGFWYAEEYHQQYLAKNPGGYCNHGFCQMPYSSPVASSE
jgi:peptide-methionine (S)-S-oxide reductase